MTDSEAVRQARALSLDIYPAVTETMRQAAARDSRLGADQAGWAVQQVVAAWVVAVDGEPATLATMARPEVADEVLHLTEVGEPPVPAGPSVTKIEVWDVAADAVPPQLRVMFQFVAGETDFVGLLDLTLPDTGPWQLASGSIKTLDAYLGYVFTSRQETAEEYQQRTGSATPAAPVTGGAPRVFRLTAGFAEHDERLGASATTDVQRDTAPTRAEAEQLIWPEIWAVTSQALGDGDWRPSLNWLDVIELRGG
jgi:hypothetical protein